MTRWKLFALAVLGCGVAFLVGATSSHVVETTPETTYRSAESDGTSADVVVQLPGSAADDAEVEVVVEYDDTSGTTTIKKGRPLHQTYPNVRKIKLRKTAGGTGDETVTVEIDPVNGSVRRSATWRTTATEPAIAFEQDDPMPVHFALSVDPGSTATILGMNGTTVVAEFFTDSTDDVNASFFGTTIKVLAGSGSGAIEYRVGT